jgi:ATP phosphoribosyltransferase regulatory subunit HisZ
MMVLLLLKNGPNASQLRRLISELQQHEIQVHSEANALCVIVEGAPERLHEVIKGNAEVYELKEGAAELKKLQERHPNLELFIQSWLATPDKPDAVPSKEGRKFTEMLKKRREDPGNPTEI